MISKSDLKCELNFWEQKIKINTRNGTESFDVLMRFYFYPRESEASRKVANLTERKNPLYTRIWCQWSCLSVCLLQHFDSISKPFGMGLSWNTAPRNRYFYTVPLVATLAYAIATSSTVHGSFAAINLANMLLLNEAFR